MKRGDLALWKKFIHRPKQESLDHQFKQFQDERFCDIPILMQDKTPKKSMLRSQNLQPKNKQTTAIVMSSTFMKTNTKFLDKIVLGDQQVKTKTFVPQFTPKHILPVRRGSLNKQENYLMVQNGRFIERAQSDSQIFPLVHLQERASLECLLKKQTHGRQLSNSKTNMQMSQTKDKILDGYLVAVSMKGKKQAPQNHTHSRRLSCSPNKKNRILKNESKNDSVSGYSPRGVRSILKSRDNDLSFAVTGWDLDDES